MMAAETNKDAGMMPPPANGAANGTNGTRRAKRKSSLEMLALSSSLPSVETSLDEFIARANQTLTDPEDWKAAEHEAKAQDEARREADALRWKAAEHQLNEGTAREAALRRQLDGLQGRLAEAEARAAVASSGSQDGLIAELKLKLARADERIHAAEEREHELVLGGRPQRRAASSPSSQRRCRAFSSSAKMPTHACSSPRPRPPRRSPPRALPPPGSPSARPTSPRSRAGSSFRRRAEGNELARRGRRVRRGARDHVRASRRHEEAERRTCGCTATRRGRAGSRWLQRLRPHRRQSSRR